MTTVLITQCLYRDSADPIGPHDPLAQPAARQLPRLGPPLGPEPVGGMGMADRLRPSRARDRRHTASACARLWRRSGVSRPTAKQRAITCSTSSYTALKKQNDLSERLSKIVIAYRRYARTAAVCASLQARTDYAA